MITSYLINETEQTFQLKEGNAGAFRLMGQLKAKGNRGAKLALKVDPNATYREYMVATGKIGESIIISSDDFCQYAVLKVIKVEPTANAPAETPVTYKLDLSKPRNPYPSTAGANPATTHASESSQAGGEPDPPRPSIAGREPDPADPSIAEREPDPGVSNPNEHTPWYKKTLSLLRFK